MDDQINTKPHYELICGDSKELLKEMQGESIDMVMTSPPYDDLRDYKGYTLDWKAIVKELFRVLRDGGVCVWVCADQTKDGGETGTCFRQALYFQECGFKLHDTMIWEKPTFTDTGSLRTRYGNVFEYMFVFVKGKIRTFNPIFDRPNKYAGKMHHRSWIRNRDGTFRRQSEKRICPELGQRFNVWHVATCNGKDRVGHPAPYPTTLCVDHILSWSNQGDVILDPFCGSGSTGVAAIRTGRRFIGVDIAQDYIDMSRRRIDEEISGVIGKDEKSVEYVKDEICGKIMIKQMDLFEA